MTLFRPIVLAMALALLATAPLTMLPRAASPDREPPPGHRPMHAGLSRNLVNLFDKNLPATWSVEPGKQKNIQWSAKLGEGTFGSPVVANGIVFASTVGRNADKQQTSAVLMAFRASDGRLLWQNAHEHPKDFVDGRFRGVPSTAAVDGNRVYYLVPDCEMICADSSTGKIHWRYDMAKELKVIPGTLIPCAEPPLAAPLIVGDLIYVATSNGTGLIGELAAPDAPSFVALHKKMGKLVWQSSLPGKNIIVGGWSSPAYANVDNVPQVIFAGGDGVIYGFVPQTGELLWKCDCLPMRTKNKSDKFFIGTPIIVGDKLYIGLGATEGFAGGNASYFLCLDITKKGDVSLKNDYAKTEANKDSALIWAFGGPIVPPPEKGRNVIFGPTVSTAAVHDGLVYIPETNGYLHCLDAATGRRIWVHDLQAWTSGSPYWVDGRVFLGTDDGVVIFAHGRTAKVLATIDFDEGMATTPVAANGVLYVMTRSKLYAIAHDKKKLKQ